MNDLTGHIELGDRTIMKIERPPKLPTDGELRARCFQCISDMRAFHMRSDFDLGYVHIPDEQTPDPTIVQQVVCDGLHDSPGCCAMKMVQYASRDSDEVITEMYADEKYERQLKTSRETAHVEASTIDASKKPKNKRALWWLMGRMFR